MTKTNAVRALERAGVAYELRTYDIDEADLSAERAAPSLVWNLRRCSRR
jgi:prolyl-tRNA editing enzyme YbaK/EbsC (Cys-tRNA(Pro) deacylase)